MNYFELFGLTIAPIVDQSLLSKKYFDLQRKNHPDFFTDASESEKETIIKLSADINNAYAIFKDAQRTIEYFLILKGIIAENEKYNLPDSFLMEMMEFNEDLLEMSKEEAIAKIERYESELFNEIKHFVENYEDDISIDSLSKIKEYYYKKKYLNRILDRLKD